MTMPTCTSTAPKMLKLHCTHAWNDSVSAEPAAQCSHTPAPKPSRCL